MATLLLLSEIYYAYVVHWAEEAVVAMVMVINVDTPSQQKEKVPQAPRPNYTKGR